MNISFWSWMLIGVIAVACYELAGVFTDWVIKKCRQWRNRR